MLLYKKVPHNFELHFEDKLFDTRPVQFLDLDSDYLEPNFKDILSNYESAVFDEWWGETHNMNLVVDDFKHLNVCRFKSFFKEVNIDTPRCFSNSKSLQRANNKYYIYKLNNYTMRHGKSLKTYVLILKALRTIYATNYITSVTRSSFSDWSTIYSLITGFHVGTKYSKLSDNLKLVAPHGKLINELGIDFNSHNDYRSKFSLNLKLLEPMFLFYIYKVSKNIFKNSRGRSGKFTFLWKYVAQYKRRYVVMSWILKEVKMQPGRDFYSRLNTVLQGIVNNPNSSFMSRIRKFSYNYVYYNCRKTLAETYRTSTK